MTHAPEPKEPEGLPLGRVTVVGVIALVIFAAGVLWAEAILGDATERQAERVPARAGDAEIGIVNQWIFDHDRRAESRRQQEQRRLASYGWVDRAAGRIHVPIEDAMKAVAAESLPRPPIVEEPPR